MDLENTKKWLLGNNIYMDIVNFAEQAGAKMADHTLRMAGGDTTLRNDFWMTFDLEMDDEARQAFAPIMQYRHDNNVSGWPEDDKLTPTLSAIGAVVRNAGCSITSAWAYYSIDDEEHKSEPLTSVVITVSINDLDAGLSYYAEQDVPAPEEQAAVLEVLDGLKAYYSGFPNDGGRKYAEALTVAIDAVKAGMMNGEVQNDG